VWRTQRRHNSATGGSYAWLVRASAFVNFFYFYCVDADFGPFFLKFSTYFPYTAKLCINGHLVVRLEVEDLRGGHATPSLVGMSADRVWVVAGLNTSITSQFRSSLPTFRKQCRVPSPLAMRWPGRTW